MGKRVGMKRKVLKNNRFELKFYDGYKGEETPKSLIIGNREFKIDKVLERKRVRDEQTGKKSEVFTCEMEGQRVRLTIHDSGKFELTYL
jgi:hypothetical protein